MIRLAPSVAMRELRRKIKDAIERRDLDALRTLQHQLILARIQTVRAAEISQIMRPARSRIEAAVAAIGLDQAADIIRQIGAAIRDLVATLRSWFAGALLGESERTAEEESDYLFAVLRPEQLRSITGQPIDNAGMLKPPPGDLPPNLTDDGMSLREVLLRISPLVVLAGDRAQSDRIGLKSIVLPPDNVSAIARGAFDSSDPSVSAPWRGKLAFILQELDSLVERVSAWIFSRVSPADILRDVRKQLDSATAGLLQELRHEALRAKGLIHDQLPALLPANVYLGYSLHSRFAPTTAPDHAARDGFRYYRDNRPGSAAPWSQRLIPPYRKNCICFTIPITETPEGDEFRAEFGLRVSGGKLISIRDVGTWQTWFDAQQPWVQKKLMGERRWFAASSTGLGRPLWADFVDRRGKVLPSRKLVAESQEQRQQRRQDVDRIIRVQTELYRRSWASTGDRFNTDPRIEEEYRRRLDAFLRRALR